MNKETLEEDLHIITMRFGDLLRDVYRPSKRINNHWKEDVDMYALSILNQQLQILRMSYRGLYMEAIERHEKDNLR